MSTKKMKISKTQILKAITENADKFKKQELLKAINEDSSSALESMAGDEEDRKIEYPDVTGIEGPDDAGDEKPGEFTDGNDGVNPEPVDGTNIQTRMSSSPSQLLEFLDKLEEAKSILSKVAAKESDQEVKNKMYSYYEKTQKLAFEMIKEFGIVH